MIHLIIFQTASIYDGCSNQKKCFGYPEGCVKEQSCEMMASLKLTKENTDVEITKNDPKRSYVAMAFSDDRLMGKDLVFACSPSWSPENVINVFWNKEGQANEKLNDKKDLPKNPSVIYKDSLITCKFSLANQLTIKGNKFDLEKGHYILLATGSVNEDTLTYHATKMASTSMFGKNANTEGNS